MQCAGDALGTYLAGAGLGLTLGTNLWNNEIKASELTATHVFVIEDGGPPPNLTFGAVAGVTSAEYQYVTILFRGADLASLQTMVRSVFGKLTKLAGQAVAGESVVLMWVAPLGGVKSRARDKLNRHWLEQRYQVVWRAS